MSVDEVSIQGMYRVRCPESSAPDVLPLPGDLHPNPAN
jgi:hypothetical protein